MAGVYRSHDAVRRWLRQRVDAWEVTEYEHERLGDAGEHVVHYLRQRVRGRATGLEFEFPPYAQVWRLGDRRVVRMMVYTDRREALSAVGLRE